MSTNYSSWNSFLQQNLNKYSSYSGGEPSKFFKSDENKFEGEDTQLCLDKFDQNSVDKFSSQFAMRLTKLPTLSQFDQASLSSYYNENKTVTVVGQKVCCVDDHPLQIVDKITAHQNLKYIESFKVAKCNTKEINLENVECVPCMSLVFNKQLTSLDAANVKEVEHLSIIKCNNLNTINFSNLACILSMKLLHVPNLAELNINSLVHANWLVLKHVDSLTEFKPKKLERANTIRICSNKNLNLIDLSKLQSAKKICVCDNPKLTELNLSSLHGLKSIEIKNNPSLKTIVLPKLEHTQKIVIESCEQLNIVENDKLLCVSKLFYIDDCHNLSRINLASVKWAKHMFIFGLDKLNGVSCNKQYKYMANGSHRIIEAKEVCCIE